MLIKHFRLLVAVMSLSLPSVVSAQDTTKAINHEIGFNTVLLVKQLISNNPSSTLPQLPYAVFYNLYFKDELGIRFGLGLNNTSIKTSVEGQAIPRQTTQNNLNLRLGLSKNIVHFQRITINAFVDGLFASSKFQTVNTQTMTSFPTGTVSTTITSTDLSSGFGAQVGVGVKYNLYKHLSLYAEVPLSLMMQTISSEVTTERTALPTQRDKNTSTSNVTSITLPSTLYLVLRF